MIIGNAKILKSFNIENIYEKDEKELAEKGNSIIYVVPFSISPNEKLIY